MIVLAPHLTNNYLEWSSVYDYIIYQCQYVVDCNTLYSGIGKRHKENIPQYFNLSNTIHVRLQFWSQVYCLSLYILALAFLVICKKRSPALITSMCFFILNGSLAVFYAYSDLGDKTLHKWLRDHKPINTFLFMFCNIGYGIGMYILIFKQWVTAY